MSPYKIFTLEVQDHALIPPEFCLSVFTSARCNPYQEASALTNAEMLLIHGLFPEAQPQDLFVSHRGWLGIRQDLVEMDVNIHTILLSVTHIQP